MDTNQNIQPYKYHLLPGQRVMIINPQGLQITKSKSQIIHELQEGSIYRNLHNHERIMLENALKQFREDHG